MADPFSIISGAAGLVSLAIQTTQLTCKYVAEVSRAGETALQCLQSLSLLRDVLVGIQETSENGELAAILGRKSRVVYTEDVQRCERVINRVRSRLAALFREDGTVKKRRALLWPFTKDESKDLIEQLQRSRDMFVASMTADSLDVAVRLHQVAADTRSDVVDIKHEVVDSRRGRELHELINWILPNDHESWRLGSNGSNLQQGTGGWLFDSPAFLDWLQDEDHNKGVLWCVGSPGSGKSVLMSQAIVRISDHASHYSQSESPLLLSHFCNHQDTHSQSPNFLIRHLIRQAALQNDHVRRNLAASTEVKDARKSGRPLQLEGLVRIFLETCLSYEGGCYIALDGLDECSDDVDDSDARHEVLRFITSSEAHGARVLVASRDLADIRKELCGYCSEVRVRVPDADLRLYITEKLRGLVKRVPQARALEDAIVQKVITNADGIFLLARLIMDNLSPSNNTNVRQIKKFLVESGFNLSNMYRETLDRIMCNSAASAELARKMLLWLCYAERPLREAEIQHALATELEDDDFDPDGITPGELFQACCMGIVVVNSEGIYGLFHQTAYDFFRSSPELTSSAAHLLISKTCLRYLSFSVLREEGPCQGLATLEERREHLALLAYAAKHWADHARQVEDDVIDIVLSFLTDDVLRQCLAQAFYHRRREDLDLRQSMFDTLPTGSTALGFACGRGLVQTAKRLLSHMDTAEEVAQGDDQGWTPLISASSYGHVEIIDLLLARAAATDNVLNEREQITNYSDVEEDEEENDAGHNDDKESKRTDVVGLDKADHTGWTPLFWAIVKGQKAAAERLLVAGACASFRDGGNWTPIDWAAFRGDRPLVTLLLQYTKLPSECDDDFVDFREGAYQPREFSPIYLAAAAGDKDTVAAILNHGLPVQEGADEAAARMYPALSKVETSYRESLNYRELSIPSVILTDSFSIKLFESAIKSNQLAIVKMLVELGSPLGAVEGEQKGRSALHIAACSGNETICEYLVAKGADSSLQDGDGNTPLDLAIIMAAIPCIWVFLDRDTNAAASTIDKGNAPAMFALGIHKSQKASAPSSARRYGNSGDRDVLIPRVQQDALYMFESLEANALALQDNLIIQSASSTDLSISSSTDNTLENDDAVIQVLDTLLARGCKINHAEPENKQTALHYFCKLSKLKVAQFLLSNGADTSITGKYGDSCLQMACCRATATIDMARILVEHGADVNTLNQFQRGPLFKASDKAPAEVVRFLIDKGAKVNVYDNLQRHPLHMACARNVQDPAIRDGTLGLIEYILPLSDSDILTRTAKHYGDGGGPTNPTVLSYAVRAENWAAVDFLLSKGAMSVDRTFISVRLWYYASDAREETFRRLVCDFDADPRADVRLGPLITYSLRQYQEEGRVAEDGFEDNLVALIDAGADIYDQGGKEMWATPLQKACWQYTIWTFGGLILVMVLLRLIFGVPNTPKFLLGKSTGAEAVRVVQEIAACNKGTIWLTLAYSEGIDRELGIEPNSGNSTSLYTRICSAG
ncbi:ankyrin [Sarocladium strictum]